MTDQLETGSFLHGLTTKRFTLLFLLGLSCFIAFARFHTYNEPLEHDITTASVIADEMHAGRRYYSEVWENKPPAVHIANLIAQILFGYGRGSIYALNVALSVITLLGVYVAASSGGMGRVAGLWAAVFWTLISGDLDLQANQPNLEAFMNGPIIWAFALLLCAPRSGNGSARSSVRWSLAIGGCLALASLYKPQCVLYGFLFAVAHVLSPPESTPAGRKQALKEVSIIAAVGAVVWIAFFAYFTITGRFRIVYITMFVYPHYYTGNILWNVARSLRPSLLYPNTLQDFAPLIFLTLIGGLIAWLKGLRRPVGLLIAYAVATQIEIGVSGRFYAHYYQLWLPLFAMGAGWAVVLLGQIIKEQLPTWMPHAFAAIALLFILQAELSVYMMDPEEWSALEYGGQYAAAEKVAAELNNILEPSETIYVFGDEPSFYFLTRRRPAVGSFFMQDVAGGPLAQELTARAINDLERNPPDLVIILNRAIGENTIGPVPAELGPKHPLRVWVSQHYCPVQRNPIKVFTVCVKPGSTIERRPAYQKLVTELNLLRER